ncbi:MAG: hypothetical protein IKO64_05620 [Kiritimatiellae bacterium]|nr:hypothetical protein [Kiritimatiellia bacterium]
MHIIVNPDRLNLPLLPMFVGARSSATWRFAFVPDRAAALQLQIERPKDGQTPRDNAAIVCVKERAGVWHAYIPPFAFPAASKALHYHLVATDGEGNPEWLGTGTLEVIDNPATGDVEPPPIVPRDTYLRNPTTGLYHKLVAELDDLGNITVAVEQEGVVK